MKKQTNILKSKIIVVILSFILISLLLNLYRNLNSFICEVQRVEDHYVTWNIDNEHVNIARILALEGFLNDKWAAVFDCGLAVISALVYLIFAIFLVYFIVQYKKDNITFSKNYFKLLKVGTGTLLGFEIGMYVIKVLLTFITRPPLNWGVVTLNFIGDFAYYGFQIVFIVCLFNLFHYGLSLQEESDCTL